MAATARGAGRVAGGPTRFVTTRPPGVGDAVGAQEFGEFVTAAVLAVFGGGRPRRRPSSAETARRREVYVSVGGTQTDTDNVRSGADTPWIQNARGAGSAYC
ncbi:hypothetical protein [Nocardia flavorosea]|uniref:hypothetical protein n=1 Tax=Nocardia flavorosea TaxID=53429 RepID=UPI0007A4BE69|nr:hypothetical protein [Nocardia flavorosea]